MRAQELIAKNKETKNIFLNLNKCGLTELPEELTDCIWLERLDFHSNQVSDILILKELKNLKILHFYSNQVIDISVLKELKNLKILGFPYNQVSDISALAELKNLEYLDFSDNQVSDISVLKKLENLVNLKFMRNQVSDISAVAELKNLEYLYFSHNQVSDISVLKELKNLENLYFSNNQVSDISVLKELKNLKDLGFDNNQIREFPYFLKNLSKIESIDFLPNPYQFKNKSISDFISKNPDIDFNNFSSFKLICEILETQTQQKPDQSEWINLKIPKDFERIFSQYLLLFKDFVAVVKGKVIDFYLRSENESLHLISNGNTNISREQILNYLEEYVALLSKNLEKPSLNIENQELSQKLSEEYDVFLLELKTEIAHLKNNVEILKFKNAKLLGKLKSKNSDIKGKNKEILELQLRLENTIRELKADGKIRIYCENKNAKLFLEMGLSGIAFFGEFDKTSVFLQIENYKSIYGIIDRDYLTDAEVQTLQTNFSNLIVLEYYCFENYLYHPENLKEVYPDFDAESYIERIRVKKEEEKYFIISKLKNDRNSYIFFKKNYLKTNEEKHLKPLFEMLESLDFEIFYKVFTMKDRKDLCQIQNIGKNIEKLVKTKWFKGKFEKMLAKIPKNK